jgi:hypothetical protein
MTTRTRKTSRRPARPELVVLLLAACSSSSSSSHRSSVDAARAPDARTESAAVKAARAHGQELFFGRAQCTA